MDRRDEKPTPTSIEPEAIGFVPAKYILQVVYTKIFNNVPHPSFSSSSSSTSTSSMSPRDAHYRAVHGAILNTVRNVNISINVLVGRKEANQSEKTQLERLGFSKRITDRLGDFQLLNPDMPIDDSLYLYSYCSDQQCFLYIQNQNYLFNHFSMPANPDSEYKIHFKEDIPQRTTREGRQIFHYEYVPFDGQGKTTTNEGTSGPVFENSGMVLLPAQAQARARERISSGLTPTELREAEAAAAAAASAKKQATTKAPRELTPEEQEKKAASALRKQQKEAEEAARKRTAEEAARRQAEEAEAARKKAEGEAEAAIQQKEEELKRIREKQAIGETLTEEERKILNKAERLRGFFAARKKKGGRSTRRRPRRRALRKTRKTYI